MAKLAKNVVLLGLGSKARNGKDTTAELIKKLEPNVHILHWADKLYEEVRNKGYEAHGMPIIKCDIYNAWFLKHAKQKGRRLDIAYDMFEFKEIPEFQELFRQCGPQYNYMLDKDPLLLQLWGTNLRRTYFGNNYWVKRTFEDIDIIAEENKNYDGLVWICVADTRFRNEASAVQEAGGIYVDVVRLNDDNTRFVAPDRDPNHPSEADLNNTKPDRILKAHNVSELSIVVKDFIHDLKHKHLN